MTMSENTDSIPVIVIDTDTKTKITVSIGTNLRDALRNHDFSPYGRLSETLNCGGNGLCATCGVRVRVYNNQQNDIADTQIHTDDNDIMYPDSGPTPNHWHDRLAARFGYPRLSCQITVSEPLVVQLLPKKLLWGGRKTKTEVTDSMRTNDADSNYR
ncbi:2Fe-2S iron-sulfur cluster-binding protein [Haloquadratum walsbyi]|jgi:ferredoxin|uniref:Ferredoxin (2Fe-2S) n=1 Tax=Haloquadratum walsbyi (strain DSM 16854 / JCM 12705 / C23) TaxID=768065 RepID=G0LJ81_HALWC|nr:2Fe-2S iron-sulfur cluster-binding protein [Haloquadratum walsbyi]CCC40649.1 ferredoxin (2Fe-2S) [Haloquadratum walsbyi C23]